MNTRLKLSLGAVALFAAVAGIANAPGPASVAVAAQPVAVPPVDAGNPAYYLPADIALRPVAGEAQAHEYH